MELSPGSQLGQYQIRARLGAGGMGEVYRASDSNLRRDVAIKLLPEALSQDPDRLPRFEREAQVLASLNHPNIGAIYDLESDGDKRFLVLELVEGETLAETLRRGPLPLAEALDVGKQIAAALEAAHQKGVLHRDLKPSNVQLTEGGLVKVLDFGLAKVMAPEATGPSESATIISPAQTRIGVILGTAAYMSPEQARGHVLDERTDLWSFGCVLYECLTGRQAFEGEDVTETLAGILKAEPDWGLLPPGTPAVIRSLLRQCLRKQRAQRLRDAGAAQLMIEDCLSAPNETVAAAAVPGRKHWRWALPLAALAVVAAAAIGRLLAPAPVPVAPPVSRLALDLRPAEAIGGTYSSARPVRQAFALSPDGRTVVFSGLLGANLQLYKRSLDESDAVPMDGTEGAESPFFSPDGRWVAFFANGKLRKAPLDGEPPSEIAVIGAAREAGGPEPAGAVWSGDTIYFGVVRGGIQSVSSSGGVPTTVFADVISEDEIVGHLLPQTLPRADVLLYTARHVSNDDRVRVVARALNGTFTKTLIEDAADARYLEVGGKGYLLYMRSGVLMGARFDVDALELLSPAIALVDNVMQSVATYTGPDEIKVGQFAVSASGTLAYLPGGIFPPLQNSVVWVGRDGSVSPAGVPTGGHIAPRISPDGQRVVLFTTREGSQSNDIQLFDIDRPVFRRLTFDSNNVWPLWLDNETIVFTVLNGPRQAPVTLNVDTSGVPAPFTSTPRQRWQAASAAVGVIATLSRSRIDYIRLDDRDAAPTPVVDSVAPVGWPALSPDGRRLAFVSIETGQPEVYVASFPEGSGKTRVSLDAGIAPVWSRDGRELYYLRGILESGRTIELTDMMAVDVGPSFGEPHVLFRMPIRSATPLTPYDVATDGRFLLVQPPATQEESATQIQLVLNWTAELERRLGALGR